ncbi:MAG TPA: two-component regulator propeller domain-containing protein [Terracidiphilus sp.]|nr:two-component regulator propeller domain-containing protein [Terracidiphilus sp.]
MRPLTGVSANASWIGPHRCGGGWRSVRLGLAAWACGAVLSFGLEPTTPLAELGRQSWVMENGLPQNSVHALVQTRDGFVWAGTEAGLARFDGVSFLVLDQGSKPALPSGDIRSLVEKDGALWIGTSEGTARWQDGTLTTFGEREGAKHGERTSLNGSSEVPAGVVGPPDGGTGGWLPGVPATDLAKDEIVFRETLANGEAVRATRGAVTIGQGSHAEVLAAGKELPGTRIQALLADREGCLWIGTNGGLARWTAGKVQLFPVSDVLARASILALLEDREGNLWAGTETDGLQVLRDARFLNIGTREGLSSELTSTVVEDSAGSIWVGTNGGGLNVIRRGEGPGSMTIHAVRDALLSDVILSLAAGRGSELWVGTPDGLNRIRGSAVDAFTSADGLPDDFIRSLLLDADGSLWIGTRRGLAHWEFSGSNESAGKKEIYTEANGLGSDLVGAMARDSQGNLWIATLTGLSRLKGGKITNYTTADGLSSNVVTSLLPRKDGSLLVGTQDNGWNLWDGTKFRTVQSPLLKNTRVHAILDDGLNHLWFATNTGIARCDCTMTADCTHWVEFGPADGLRSRETATNSHPSALRSRDGHLWFATPRGLVEVDPAHFPVNTLPPPVVVEHFAVDDVDALHAAGAPVRVAAGHNHFQFDYAGLSFVAPQKVRYRYMLEGFDHDWTEAGARRVAYYTNIPPGEYTFRVQAANNDGVWNTQGAALEFDLQPHFYQTLWFYILLSLAAAGLIAVVLRRRLEVAEREFKAVLGERNRIAREIHDTLAQGYVGISVQLEVLAELLRHHKVDEAERQLDTTRGHVREGLAEARQSIWALRSQDAGEKTLPVSLRRTTEQAGSHGLESAFSVHGAYRPLPPGTEREIVRVAQEAIHNVKKHAAAKHLFVELDYGQTDIALEVRDDGRGFAAHEVSVSPPGHYGLTGMRERAAAIGGTLEVRSEAGAGTTVRLHAPTLKEGE